MRDALRARAVATRLRLDEWSWPLLYAAARKCERLSRDAASHGRRRAGERLWALADWFGRKARSAERRIRTSAP